VAALVQADRQERRSPLRLADNPRAVDTYRDGAREMTRLGTVAAIAALLTAAYAPAAQAAASRDVTADPLVQRDLALAVAYWTAARPDLTTPCSPEQVFVQTLAPGVGNGGIAQAGVNIWAETALGSCEIDISKFAWREIRTAPKMGGKYGVCTVVFHGDTGTCATQGYSQYDVCVRVAHEYAHTLGLGDLAGGPEILNQNAAGGDPLCTLAYSPTRLTHFAIGWLLLHRLAPVGLVSS
jgi:hypothetical protein